MPGHCSSITALGLLEWVKLSELPAGMTGWHLPILIHGLHHK